MEKNKIKILIPSRNEIKTLKKICLDIRGLNFDLLVIDDNSDDGTLTWLKRNSFNFIRNNKNIGYERSLIVGIKHLLKNKTTEYIVTFDADGEHQIKDLKKITKILKSNIVDIIIGNRDKLNRWTEYLLSFLFLVRFGIKDPLSGLKGYSANKLRLFQHKIKNNYFMVDLIILFRKKNFSSKNITINVKKRKGESRVKNNLLVNLKILKLIKCLI